MKELHTFGWYAARVSPHLPKKHLNQCLLVYLVDWLICLWHWRLISIGVFELNVWANLGIAIVLGLCFASLGFLGHEILHGTVVRKAWLRDFLGAIAFMPLSTGPKLWRKWHNATHHVHSMKRMIQMHGRHLRNLRRVSF